MKSEDQVYFYSWIILVACGMSGFVQIPITSSQSLKKLKYLATFLRCLGWIALNVSAASHVAHYYWYFPPALATVAVLISVNYLYT